MFNELTARSSAVIEYKRRALSLLSPRGCPIATLGQVNVQPVIDHLLELDVMRDSPSQSRGFHNMSELWLQGTFKEPSTKMERLIQPIVFAVQVAAEVRVKRPMKVFKAVIDTINEGSCLLPHGDDYFHHGLALRVHVPLITTEGSIGLSFHPSTYDAHAWRMGKVGRVYAFNNFEPHTVTKLDAGIRSHLIMDVVVADLYSGLDIAEATAALLSFGEGNTGSYSPNFITSTIGNLAIRNNLARRYGGDQHSTHAEQMSASNIEITRRWVQRLARDAHSAGQVQVL